MWLTRYVLQTWKICEGMSLFKIDNDFAAHLLSLEMAKVSSYRHVLHQLALGELQTSNSPRQYPDGKSPHSFLFRVLY